jgi:hypothetical protein
MTKPTTPLRQRMIEDMAIRNMSPLTQAAYIRSVANFAAHYRTSPDKLTFEDVRNYQVHLVSRGLKTATIIPIMCAIRFLYGTTVRPKCRRSSSMLKPCDMITRSDRTQWN